MPLVLVVISGGMNITNNFTDVKVLEFLAKITDEMKQNITMSVTKQRI